MLPKTLSEKTYRELRRRVLSGELEAGSQLVNRSLAETLAVSMAPVREAIHRLATEGLVEYLPGAGAFVRRANTTDLEELYVLREALESCAAAEAARNISAAQLANISEIRREFDGMETAVRALRGQPASDEMLDSWLDLEERFHAGIVEAARNRMLAKVIQDYMALGRVFGIQRHRAAVLTENVARDTCRDHGDIVEAIGAHDPESARRLMGAHIRRGSLMVRELFRASR